MHKKEMTPFQVPPEKMRGPRIAVLSRAMFSYHSRVVWGFLKRLEDQPDIDWRPVMFLCKEARVDVMAEQLKEISAEKYDLILPIGALYAKMVADYIRDKKIAIPTVFCGVTDPVQFGVLPSLEPQHLITGITREQVAPTYLADFLPLIRPGMKRVFIPYYPMAEFGFMEVRLKLLADRFAQLNIEAILFPVNAMLEVLPGVLRYIGTIDSIIVPEGIFVTDVAPALSRLCKQYKVMFVSHSMESVGSSAAIMFTQNVEAVGHALFASAEQVLSGGKMPHEIPINVLPDDRRIIVDVNACREQGVDLDAIALFCGNNNIIIKDGDGSDAV